MGRKNRKKNKFRAEEKDDFLARSEKKHVEYKEKERDIIDKFEEKLNQSPAFILKSGFLADDQMRRDTPRPKVNRKGSDGLGVVHPTITTLASELSSKGKRKHSRVYDAEEDEEVQFVPKRNKLDAKRRSSLKTPESNNGITRSKENGVAFNYSGCSSNYTDSLAVNVSDSQICSANGGEELSTKFSFQTENEDESSDSIDSKYVGYEVANGNEDEVEDESVSLDEEEIDEEKLSMDDEELQNLIDDEEEVSMDDEELQDFNDEENDEDIEDEDSENGSLFDSEFSDLGNQSLSFNIIGYTASVASPDCVVLKAKSDFSIAAKPFKVFCFSDDADHSIQVGLKALSWVLSPMESQTFFKKFFQKRVLVIKRSCADYYKGFFSTADFMEMVSNNFLLYGTNINLATYVDGIRQSHHSEGCRAYSNDIQKQLSLNRSVQCINPQSFNDNVWYLCEVLQEVFCSFVGANNYITPAGSAGFAPHWDDVDTFMLQIEGRKHWRIFKPDQLHPMEPSANFTDSDFKGKTPVFDGYLDKGDLLYVPRGFIHQAKTDPHVHSHHVTLSACRKFTFSDFASKAVDLFVSDITEKSTKMRSCLPPILFDCNGLANVAYENDDSAAAEKIGLFSQSIAKTFNQRFSHLMPATIDSMAKEFMRGALPPLLTPFEKGHSCLAFISDAFAKRKEISVQTEVRLIRKHSQRLIFEDNNNSYLIHRMSNSRIFEEREESVVDFPVEFENCFATLVDNYPSWTKVGDLSPNKKNSLKLSNLLYDHCLLLVKFGDTVKQDLPTNKNIISTMTNQNTDKKTNKKKKKRKNKDKKLKE